MLKINPVLMNADAAKAVRSSVSGNLARLAEQSLEASTLMSQKTGAPSSEDVKMVDDILEDLSTLTELLRSPILHYIAMK